MKKIIITGGCGFIGSYLVHSALKRKFRVLNIDKISYASRNLNIKHKNYTLVKADLINTKKLEKIFNKFKPDFIINCAAESHVDRSIDNPDIFFQSNLLGTLNLLNETIKIKKKIRFLQVSTDEVFGSLKFNKMKFNENSNYKPNSPYSASKASADHLVRAYGETFGLNYVITNCSNNFGPFQYPEKLIPVVIKNLINKSKIPIYGNGKNIRDWIYVQDHVDAIFKCLLNGKKNNTYLIGSDNELSNIELVKIICKRYKKITNDNFNYLKLISYIKDRQGHDLRYAINAKKIKNQLGWKPKNKFQISLDKTIKFYIDNRNFIKKFYTRDTWLKKKYA